LTNYIAGGNISPMDISMKKRVSPQRVALTPPVFQILLALAERERHGYGIMQAVARQAEDSPRMGPGTLYGCLKRMLAGGLVEESDERPDPALDDQRRRYYRLTERGHRVARAEAQRMERMVKAARACRVLTRRPAAAGGGN
jgi:DNA-binding PadR family transcriptional regulator